MQSPPVVASRRYRILGKVGEGCTSEVFRALDIRLERVVALKVLREPFREQESFARSFEDEAQAIARVTHPHVVRVYDYGWQDGRGFMVMEFVPGRTLKAYLSGLAVSGGEETGRLAEQLLQGLSAVRRAGITHTRVTPEHVLVSGAGVLKIANLGFGKPAGAGGVYNAAKCFSDSKYVASPTAPGRDLHLIGPEMGSLLYESEDWLERSIPCIDSMGRTVPREAEGPRPAGRYVLEAPVGRCPVADRAAASGIGESDSTIAVAAVRGDASEAPTVRLLATSNTQLRVMKWLRRTQANRLAMSLSARFVGNKILAPEQVVQALPAD